MKSLKYLALLFSLAITVVIIYYFFPYHKLTESVIVDKLEVYKSRHQMFAYSHNKLINAYTIAIGKNPNGNKVIEGDCKTPEGEYFIDSKNPYSDYHKNLGISYPNAADKLQASLQGKSPGSEIKIHGLNNRFSFIGRFHRWTDWTNGCIALTNEEMDDLYQHTPIGTRIIIYP